MLFEAKKTQTQLLLLGISVSSSLALCEQNNLEVICCFVHFPALILQKCVTINTSLAFFPLVIVAVGSIVWAYL